MPVGLEPWVVGVQNLRVADVSLMPRIAAGVATMATYVLIRAHMAEILGAGI